MGTLMKSVTVNFTTADISAIGLLNSYLYISIVTFFNITQLALTTVQ